MHIIQWILCVVLTFPACSGHSTAPAIPPPIENDQQSLEASVPRQRQPSQTELQRLCTTVVDTVANAELLWHLAELEMDPLLATERWEKAARQFTCVVALADNDTQIREAAYAAVLAWQNALKVAADADVKVPTRLSNDSEHTSDPVLIPKRQQALLAAFDDYLRLAVGAEVSKVTMMRFLKARLLWRYNQHDKALPILKAIVDDQLNSEAGVYAVNLLLDTLLRTRRYDELFRVARQLRAQKSFLQDRADLAERLDILLSKRKKGANVP